MSIFWGVLVVPIQGIMPIRPVPLFLSSVAGEEDPGASVSAPVPPPPDTPTDSGCVEDLQRAQTDQATTHPNPTTGAPKADSKPRSGAR